jgi:hypothetical protein
MTRLELVGLVVLELGLVAGLVLGLRFLLVAAAEPLAWLFVVGPLAFGLFATLLVALWVFAIIVRGVGNLGDTDE